MLLVWPRHGEPALVLNSFAAPLARKDSWIERVAQYDDYGESAYAKAAAVLGDLGLSDGRLGLEKSYVNAAHWEEVHGAPSRCPHSRLHGDDARGPLGEDSRRGGAY